MAASKSVKLNIPQYLLLEFDEVWPKKYNSRTDAILDGIRKIIIELEATEH